MATRKKLSNRRKKQISKDCWDMDYAFYNWMLEHLKVYLKDASPVVDLTYNKEEYNGVEYTQEEAVKRMIKLCENLTNDRTSYIFSEDCQRDAEELIDLWKIWHRAMWW